MKLIIHHQIPTVQPLEFGKGKVISSSIQWAYGYLPMLGLKLIHASERELGSMHSFAPAAICLKKDFTLVPNIQSSYLG